MRRVGCLTLILLMLITPVTGMAATEGMADSLFATYVYGPKNLYVQTLDAYMAMENINLDTSVPEDFCIDRVTGSVFVADTGNGRILEYSGEDVHIWGDSLLASPTGVSVDADKIYVADSGLKQVVIISRESGEAVMHIERPDTPVYGRYTGYVPRKVSSDARGNIYVISDNSPNGVLQFNGDGLFMGFTGANLARLGWVTTLQRLLYTEAQKSQLIDVRPPSPTNLTINNEGLLFTATVGVAESGIKKFSTSGNMILTPDLTANTFIDVATDDLGNIYALENNGTVHVTEAQGWLLFFFGTNTPYYECAGITRKPVAIDIDASGTIYLLDRELSALMRYKPTDFGDMVLKAADYYVQGLYVQSQPMWQEIEELNSTFTMAHLALGSAYYKQGRYAEALEAFRVSEYELGYSEVVWYLRNEWLQRYLQYVLLALIAILVLNFIMKLILRRMGITKPLKRLCEGLIGLCPNPVRQLERELRFSLYYVRHPLDGVYEIKRNAAVGAGAATLLYLFYLFAQLITPQWTNYIFKSVLLFNNMSLPAVLLGASVPFVLGIIASYLVSDINEGEATFRQVYIIIACSLVPYSLLSLLRAVISNVLTRNESFIFSFTGWIAIVWSAFLVVAGLKEAYNYNVKEISKNLSLTAFTMACMVVVTAVAAMLVTQEASFIQTLLGEVALRARG